MFIIQCPIVWYAKVCALPSAHSSYMLDLDPVPLLHTFLLHLIATSTNYKAPPKKDGMSTWNQSENLFLCASCTETFSPEKLNILRGAQFQDLNQALLCGLIKSEWSAIRSRLWKHTLLLLLRGADLWMHINFIFWGGLILEKQRDAFMCVCFLHILFNSSPIGSVMWSERVKKAFFFSSGLYSGEVFLVFLPRESQIWNKSSFRLKKTLIWHVFVFRIKNIALY